MSEQVTGTLENWFRQQVSNKEFILYGSIFGDIHERFPDGYEIHTSGIKNIEIQEGDIVRTRNSTYKLGKQFIAD